MLVARTRTGGLTSIGTCVSVNDSGSVAFTGSLGQGQGLFVADGPFSPGGASQARNINPKVTGDPAQAFSPFVQINNAGTVLAQDMTPGAPPATSVRLWDPAVKDGNSTVATQGGPNGFDAVLGQPPSAGRRERRDPGT